MAHRLCVSHKSRVEKHKNNKKKKVLKPSVVADVLERNGHGVHHPASLDTRRA